MKFLTFFHLLPMNYSILWSWSVFFIYLLIKIEVVQKHAKGISAPLTVISRWFWWSDKDGVPSQPEYVVTTLLYKLINSDPIKPCGECFGIGLSVKIEMVNCARRKVFGIDNAISSLKGGSWIDVVINLELHLSSDWMSWPIWRSGGTAILLGSNLFQRRGQPL